MGESAPGLRTIVSDSITSYNDQLVHLGNCGTHEVGGLGGGSQCVTIRRRYGETYSSTLELRLFPPSARCGRDQPEVSGTGFRAIYIDPDESFQRHAS